MDVPYVTRETWMICLSYIRKLHRSRQLWEITRRMGRLRENGNLPINLSRGDKMLVATVEPSELQGPQGSSLLWSVTRAQVL